MATTRKWCDKHRDMGPHEGTRCLTCDPEPPTAPAPVAEVLAFELAPQISALDVIRARGDLGATVREIREAGADASELVELEIASQVETRFRGRQVERDGLLVWFWTGRKEVRAA